MTDVLRLSLSGRNLQALARRIASSPHFRNSTPDALEVDYTEQPPTAGWVDRLDGSEQVVEATWEDERRLAVYPGLTVDVSLPLAPDPPVIMAWLQELDFELASFQSLHPEWQIIDPDYVAPGFADRHRPHGPFAAFKGRGHDRLVSRRWLEYSPVRLVTSGDLSFVQFHDLHADAATSLRQARPGHAALSSKPEGGFIKQGYLPRHEFTGVFDEGRGVLKVAVIGRPVLPREQLDACALRGDVRGRRVANVAFVFLDEREVGDHLHQMWARGLECWTIRDGREVRLDDAYVPPAPVPPEWAR